MVEIKTDISKLSTNLFEKAIDCLTHDSQFVYDQENKEMRKNENPPEMILEKGGVVKFWIIFSTGIEMLLKSVLVKHDCLPFFKKEKKENQLRESATNYVSCLKVYRDFMKIFSIYAPDNLEINIRLKKEKIGLLYELNLGTLISCQGHVACLRNKGILSDEEWENIYNSVQVLADVRRNFDIHSYSNINVMGSINGDLDELYLPMINILLKK